MPECGALDAGGVGGLVENTGELEVPGEVVGEGEDHGAREEEPLQLVELSGMRQKSVVKGASHLRGDFEFF